MKISFLADSESGVNVFNELIVKIKEEIVDIETDEVFVPTRLDLPKKAFDLAPQSDLIFVLCLYPKQDALIETVLSKLIDVELKTGISIVKAFVESDLFEMDDEDEIAIEKTELAEKWSAFLVKYLFNPGEFKAE